jgi:hypothetical protein
MSATGEFLADGRDIVASSCVKSSQRAFAHNGSRLGEVAEHKTSLELQTLKLK